jgi:hypothetical protein
MDGAETDMSTDVRLKLGVSLLVIGLVMPAGVPFVVGSDWLAGMKAVVSGVLMFGPELMAVAAVALMGKENFDRIIQRVKGGLGGLKPARDVSRSRHVVGLVLFLAPALFAWIASYIPSLMPAEYTLRVAVNLGIDAIFLAGLFVLGGDFWDKVRALFVREARAVFPPSLSTHKTARKRISILPPPNDA